MSKERARRRAERRALAARDRAARAATLARRARRRALARRLRPVLPPRGRTGRLFARRSYAQRVTIVLVVAAALAWVWMSVEDTATRIALTALLVVALPALVVLAFGRRT